MDLDILQEYFRGERSVGFVIPFVGLGLLAFAGWVWRTQEGGFAWGLLVPLALVGVITLVAGPLFAMKTDRQVAELLAQHEEAPAQMVAAERARMAKVNANWVRLKIVWTVIAAVAMSMLLFVKKDWAQGLGLGLMVLVTVLFFVDTLGERRGVIYEAALLAANT